MTCSGTTPSSSIKLGNYKALYKLVFNLPAFPFILPFSSSSGSSFLGEQTGKREENRPVHKHTAGLCAATEGPLSSPLSCSRCLASPLPAPAATRHYVALICPGVTTCSPPWLRLSPQQGIPMNPITTVPTELDFNLGQQQVYGAGWLGVTTSWFVQTTHKHCLLHDMRKGQDKREFYANTLPSR